MISMRWTIVLGIGIVWLLATLSSSAQKLKITGQRDLTIQQGQSIMISLSDITVDADAELNYPSGFYLEIDDGDHYSVNGNTIIPSGDFSGELKVKIRVTNGHKKSEKFNLKINVVPNGDGGDDDDTNAKPTIINQVSVEINKNQSFQILLSHLVVSDPDSSYPADFSLKVESGSNYTVSGSTITPTAGFVGNLSVKVRVNDGQMDSDVFNFVITVKDIEPVNVKPVITAQSSLSTFKNESLAILLSNLSVTDPDDSYPSDFTLVILPGANYAVSGNTITPSSGFVGSLTVKVKVNDGSDDSNVFDLKINVVERSSLQILGQSSIIIHEDTPYTFQLSDLHVSDPSSKYPSGFSISILDGDNYAVEGTTIYPEKDYHGNLIVPLNISNATTASSVFEALIVVQPVNDSPVFATFDETPITSPIVAVDIAIAREVKTGDVDNENLAYAEVQLDSAEDITTLSYINTANITGVFDQSSGILIFLGQASLAEYDQALQSVMFSSSDSISTTRRVHFRLNDGISFSSVYTKTITSGDSELDILIPSAFTPNNDNANDTWEISLLQRSPDTEVKLRVYNSEGLLLFESDSLDNPWDGRFKGEFLPPASYFYTMIITDPGRREQRNGMVTILR
jgi:gliding motility-associated-like protein